MRRTALLLLLAGCFHVGPRDEHLPCPAGAVWVPAEDGCYWSSPRCPDLGCYASSAPTASPDPCWCDAMYRPDAGWLVNPVPNELVIYTTKGGHYTELGRIQIPHDVQGIEARLEGPDGGAP